MEIRLPVLVEVGVRQLVLGLDTAWARLVPRRMTARTALSAQMGSVRTLDMANESAAILCEQRNKPTHIFKDNMGSSFCPARISRYLTTFLIGRRGKVPGKDRESSSREA